MIGRSPAVVNHDGDDELLATRQHRERERTRTEPNQQSIVMVETNWDVVCCITHFFGSLGSPRPSAPVAHFVCSSRGSEIHWGGPIHGRGCRNDDQTNMAPPSWRSSKRGCRCALVDHGGETTDRPAVVERNESATAERSGRLRPAVRSSGPASDDDVDESNINAGHASLSKKLRADWP
jgi:hypothetical protein